MRKRSTATPAALVAVGALLGWAAASARPDGLLHAQTGAAPFSSPAGSPCCEAGAGRAIALAVGVPAAPIDTPTAPSHTNQAGSGEKPNILVIFGDDIGQTNVSAYSMGLMGYRTPNIDRIAREGMIFTDYCAEQSCTAGRSSFLTGQCTFRTGLSKVGVPAAP